jgi:transcriptional regulator with XRE-family HTH domain
MMTEKEHYFLLRRKKKITHIELAKYIGCSQSLISRYERGNSDMSKQKKERYRSYIDQK